jgi:hypothetical protein
MSALECDYCGPPEDCDCRGCECHDSPAEHQAWLREESAYWSAYFGQNSGTKEQQRATLERMDPRPVSAEQMDEYRSLK